MEEHCRILGRLPGEFDQMLYDTPTPQVQMGEGEGLNGAFATPPPFSFLSGIGQHAI